MKISLSKEIYPVEAILNACYVFLEKFYFFLEEDKKNKTINVNFKIKQKKPGKNSEEELKDEFMNELIHSCLRYRISKNNKKIREYIVGRALYTPFSGSEFDILQGQEDEKLDYRDDPLGIAIPWEEKFQKKEKNAKVKIQ